MIVVFAITAAVGMLLMIVVPGDNKGVLLLGYDLVSCLAAITPMVYAWETQNTSGDTKRKCTSAIVSIGMCTGNVSLQGSLLLETEQPGHWTATVFHVPGTSIPARVDIESHTPRVGSGV